MLWITSLFVAHASDGTALKAAAELPAVAKALREDGVPVKEVSEAIEAGHGKGLETEEIKETLEEADRAAKENGPIDNFGAFVQSKLDEGLRGRELAAAIRAEHQARGKGKGRGKGVDGAPGRGNGAAKGQGQGNGERGKPDKGPSGSRPDGKGQGMNRPGGKPAGKGKGSGKSKAGGMSRPGGKK